MAVISIIMTAPLGAILINTLGVKWLNDDTELTGDDETPKNDKNQSDNSLQDMNKVHAVLELKSINDDSP